MFSIALISIFVYIPLFFVYLSHPEIFFANIVIVSIVFGVFF